MMWGLTNVEVSVSLEHLDGRILASIVHIPMVDAGSGDEAECGVADPLPELHILVHGARLELLLLLQVEDLKRPRLGLERNDLSVPVHDRTIGLDWSTSNIVVVLELDNDDLGLSGLALLFSDAHI